MSDWDYGGVHRRFNLEGEIALPHDSRVQVCDWIDTLPAFMRRADTIFVDPPWNVGNLNTFYTKADLPHRGLDFPTFSRHLWGRLDEIAPKTLFVEMGKEFLALYLQEAQARYRYVTFYNSTYYRKQQNKCYVLHATNDFRHRRYRDLEDLDEHDIIAWICRNHHYECIGDLCMGTGLVGRGAFDNQKSFVGTELNPKRLALLLAYIREHESSKQDPTKPL